MTTVGGENNHAILKQRVEDRILEWRCKIENPRTKGPFRITAGATASSTSSPTPSTTNIPSSDKILERLPKIAAFETRNAMSGGAGAPRRTPSGRILTEVRGHPDIRFHQRDSSVFEQSMRYQLDKDKIRRYKEDLDNQLAEKEKLHHASINNSTSSGTPWSRSNGYDRGSTLDLATLMSSSNANTMRRWESLPKLTSTDVTRNFVNSPRTPDQEEYKRGLEIQLERKRMEQQEIEKHEQQLNSLHFNAFDNFWGKPTGPKRKENLFKLLHSVTIGTNKNLQKQQQSSQK